MGHWNRILIPSEFFQRIAVTGVQFFDPFSQKVGVPGRRHPPNHGSNDRERAIDDPQHALAHVDTAKLVVAAPAKRVVRKVADRTQHAGDRIAVLGFDIGMGDAVMAWGFGPEAAAPDGIRTAMAASRRPAHDVLEINGEHVRKAAPIALDLNGIAKGYGVDRLAEILRNQGISDGLVGIDGEMRAMGLRPDGEAWTIAVEAPDAERRTPHSILALQDAAVATSGDYRHWVEVQGRRLSHTMDLRRGAPLIASPASITVVARSCAEADAWATALMVLGPVKGATLAKQSGLDALFLLRDDVVNVRGVGVGRLFSEEPAAIASAEGR